MSILSIVLFEEHTFCTHNITMFITKEKFSYHLKWEILAELVFKVCLCYHTNHSKLFASDLQKLNIFIFNKYSELGEIKEKRFCLVSQVCQFKFWCKNSCPGRERAVAICKARTVKGLQDNAFLHSKWGDTLMQWVTEDVWTFL